MCVDRSSQFFHEREADRIVIIFIIIEDPVRVAIDYSTQQELDVVFGVMKIGPVDQKAVGIPHLVIYTDGWVIAAALRQHELKIQESR